MKLKSLLLALAAFGSVACSDSENGENLPSAADVAGTYAGYALTSCAYFSNTCSAAQTVTVPETADGSAAVAFDSDMGAFLISDVRIDAGERGRSLSGEGTVQMGMQGNISTYDCTFEGVIASRTEATMRFSVPAVMGGLTVEFRTGEAPADLLLAGTYKGYSDADCAYFEDRYTDDESLKMTAVGDGTLAVVFESSAWGAFSVASAAIESEGGEYLLSGSGSVTMGMGESTSSYDFTMTGRVDAAKEAYSVAFHVPAVMGGLTVTLLPGTAPATEE
ncbi:MAG: hypothetical protein K2H69_05740 [Alistipes sp.]|nr:hypothetical protein [Alistipes sp.]